MMKMNRELEWNLRNLVQNKMRNTTVKIIADAIDFDVAKQVKYLWKFLSPFPKPPMYIEREV